MHVLSHNILSHYSLMHVLSHCLTSLFSYHLLCSVYGWCQLQLQGANCYNACRKLARRNICRKYSTFPCAFLAAFPLTSWDFKGQIVEIPVVNSSEKISDGCCNFLCCSSFPLRSYSCRILAMFMSCSCFSSRSPPVLVGQLLSPSP